MLWRHGRTDWNSERRFQGHTDIALNALGQEQARQSAARLANLKPDRIISSDMSRAVDTAQALAGLVGLTVTQDVGFRETSGGRWEGQRDTDLAGDPEYVAWSAGGDVPAGGAERRSDVAARASASMKAAVDELGDGQLLVVVTHGGTIRCLLGSMLELRIEQWRIFGGLANCCWSVVEEGRSGWRLTEHNAGSLPEAVLGDDR